MKVYVDELPKSCSYCPCKCFETDKCQLDKSINCPWDYEDNKRPKTCPLQSISDYTKQARKEVCEEIRVKAEDCYGEECYEGYIPTAWVISEEKLKQIQVNN